MILNNLEPWEVQLLEEHIAKESTGCSRSLTTSSPHSYPKVSNSSKVSWSGAPKQPTYIGKWPSPLKRKLDLEESSQSLARESIASSLGQMPSINMSKRMKPLSPIPDSSWECVPTSVTVVKIGIVSTKMLNAELSMISLPTLSFDIMGTCEELQTILLSSLKENLLDAFVITDHQESESRFGLATKLSVKFTRRTPPPDGGMVTVENLLSLLTNIPEVFPCLVYSAGRTSTHVVLKLKAEAFPYTQR